MKKLMTLIICSENTHSIALDIVIGKNKVIRGLTEWTTAVRSPSLTRSTVVAFLFFNSRFRTILSSAAFANRYVAVKHKIMLRIHTASKTCLVNMEIVLHDFEGFEKLVKLQL